MNGEERATVTTDAAGAQPRGILRYDPALDDELFAFQRAAYPQRRDDWVEPRWRWMFLDSARRLGTEPMVWLYRGKNGITGHQGAIAVRLQVGNEELITGWFVETIVLESVRGRAVGPMLIKNAHEDMPLNLSLGQTVQMRDIQLALGWKQIASLPIFMHVLQPRRVLAGKGSGPIARGLAAAGISSWQRIRRLRRLAGAAGHDWNEIKRFDQRHDRLWHDVKSDYVCAAVRDASYLNWKYVDQPGQDFVRLELLRDGKPAAVVVLMFREPDDDYRYRRGFIVDLVAPLSQSRVVEAALDASLLVARRHGADAVLLNALGAPLEQAALRCGFLRRPATRYFLLAVDDPAGPRTKLMLNPRHWFLTLGDSDIDRPW